MREYFLFPFLLFTVLISLNVYSGTRDFLSSKDDPGAGLLPVPQSVSLTGQEYLLDNNWLINAGSNIPKEDPAVESLSSVLKDRFGLTIKMNTAAKSGNKVIRLLVKAGSVTIGKSTDTNCTALMQQAYHLQLDKEKITITANAPQGLYYGVQTLIQLLQEDNGKIYFVGGAITDWPDMDLRMIYWDDAHHLERLDAMKRAIKQASGYKINAFALKLEGHFEFESAKPIVEPYAYTAAEYQELTDYAKAQYVELVPYLDAPAHISFILKHPEYMGLRAFPNSNYELGVINPKADELMLGMINDLIGANKGGKYFLLSTDEAYYVGKSESEKKRAEELGGNGRLYAEYITKIANELHEKGRKVIIWTEYPLTPSDINSLPSYIINGVYAGRFYAKNTDDKWTPKFKENSMRQLIYTSTQGVEPLSPNYYILHAKKNLIEQNSLAIIDDEKQQGEISKGNVEEVLEGISSSVAVGKSDFMGMVVAAWGDAGLNPETFWLGYAAGTAAGWNSNSMTSQDVTNRFYHSFYGNKAVNMPRVYQLLSTQAQFYDDSWEWQPSKNRTPIFGSSIPIFGNSREMFESPKPAKDQTLPFLPVPSAQNLSLIKDWSANNKQRLQLAEEFLKENNELMNLLHENLISVDYQHYNLEVLHSISRLCRQNLNMLFGLKRINDFLILSSDVASTNPAVAVSLIDQALDQAKRIRNERNEVLRSVTTVWYQDWFPKVAEANGRKFLDKVDDVKDHLPVRTVDMSYLIYRELKYPLGKWAEEVLEVRNEFAKRNNLPISTESLNWEKY